MGAYSGIVNKTKKQRVSNYWKGNRWCDLYQVMHQFVWDKTDDIYSADYEGMSLFVYDENTNEMKYVNIQYYLCVDDETPPPIEITDGQGYLTTSYSVTYTYDIPSKTIKKLKRNIELELSDDEISKVEGIVARILHNPNIDDFDKLGYNWEEFEETYTGYNHIPDWNEEMVCRVSGYKYQDTREQARKRFDPVFHMN